MKIILTLAFLLVTGILSAQDLSHKDQIIEHIGQDRFDRLTQNNSSYLDFMNERCEMGFSLLMLEDEKTEGFEKINEVILMNSDKTETIVSIENFIEMLESGTLNILQVKLAYSQSSFTYYKLGNSGKVLVLNSVDSITKSLNK